MAATISATELGRSLSDILNRIRYRGESFNVERNGERVATLGPPGPTLGVTMRQVADRMRNIASPGDGFADDLEAVQSSQAPVEIPKWDS
jgi:antitoxin (DNA-binding transcriptional repressor) of toxin-antitoxin stability system